MQLAPDEECDNSIKCFDGETSCLLLHQESFHRPVCEQRRSVVAPPAILKLLREGSDEHGLGCSPAADCNCVGGCALHVLSAVLKERCDDFRDGAVFEVVNGT